MGNKSFTLIELLVVIAIIGLLSSIVLVSMGGLGAKARIIKELEFGQSIQHALGAYAVGIWSFDEGSGTTVLDGSGYGKNGTITGAVFTTETPHKVAGMETGKYALEFDGQDDYVSVGNLGIPANGPATIEGWFRFDIMAVTKGTYINLHTQLYQHPSNNYLYLGGGGADFFDVASVLQINKWYHIVLTYNGTHETATLYINGIKYNVAIQTPNSSHASFSSFTIGQIFDGFIDEVRVYEWVLSLSEIEKHYVEGLERHNNIAMNR